MTEIENQDVTISGLIASIVRTLDGFPVNQVQAEEDVTESIPETPIVQLYFEEHELPSTETDRITMGSRQVKPKVRKEFLFHLDIYARQRSQIGEDLVAATRLLDAALLVLEAQAQKPYFGNPAIKSFTYSAKRVLFDYAQVQYSGVRVPITVNIM